MLLKIPNEILEQIIQHSPSLNFVLRHVCRDLRATLSSSRREQSVCHLLFEHEHLIDWLHQVNWRPTLVEWLCAIRAGCIEALQMPYHSHASSQAIAIAIAHDISQRSYAYFKKLLAHNLPIDLEVCQAHNWQLLHQMTVSWPVVIERMAYMNVWMPSSELRVSSASSRDVEFYLLLRAFRSSSSHFVDYLHHFDNLLTLTFIEALVRLGYFLNRIDEILAIDSVINCSFYTSSAIQLCSQPAQLDSLVKASSLIGLRFDFYQRVLACGTLAQVQRYWYQGYVQLIRLSHLYTQTDVKVYEWLVQRGCNFTHQLNWQLDILKLGHLTLVHQHIERIPLNVSTLCILIHHCELHCFDSVCQHQRLLAKYIHDLNSSSLVPVMWASKNSLAHWSVELIERSLVEQRYLRPACFYDLKRAFWIAEHCNLRSKGVRMYLREVLLRSKDLCRLSQITIRRELRDRLS